MQARDLSKADFLERLAEFLDGQIPPDVMRKAWVRRQALDMNMPFDTFASYLCGQYEPGAINWLKLCRHFPELHQHVTGEAAPGSVDGQALNSAINQAQGLVYDLKRLRGDANVTTLEKKGTVS